MTVNKFARLKATGWQAGTAGDFLELTKEESRLVELKLSQITAVKKSRNKRRLSQAELPTQVVSNLTPA